MAGRRAFRRVSKGVAQGGQPPDRLIQLIRLVRQPRPINPRRTVEAQHVADLVQRETR